MPSALIKINQGAGAYTDVPGRAVVGKYGAGTVVFSNGDDTDVVNWRYTLLNVPPSSAIPLTDQDGATPTFTMATPDRRGCYRLELVTTDAAGVEDTDIRVFAVPLPNLGIIIPPYQRDPDPLPLTGTGAKPDEMNFGGQAYGFSGDVTTTRKLLYQALSAIDAAGYSPAISSFPTTDATANQVARAFDCSVLETGLYLVKAEFLADGVADNACLSKIGLYQVTAGVPTLIGSIGSDFTTIASAGAAAWASNLTVSGSNIQCVVTGAAATNISWTPNLTIRRTA